MIVKRIPAPKLMSYRGYRKYLRLTFSCRCAFCTIHEGDLGGLRFFTIEHLVPQSRDTTLQHQYSNLLYACDECNALKGGDWHTGDPVITGRGYLDPCVHDYDLYFKVWNDGVMEGLAPVADYMIEHLWLNRRFLITLRLERNKDQDRLLEYDKLITQTRRILDATSDPQKKSEARRVVSNLQAAKSLVQARITECQICRPEAHWKKIAQVRKVPLDIKKTRREKPMLIRKRSVP